MKKGFEPAKQKPKKKSRVTTVRDILAHDSVNNILDQLEQNKGDIEGMLVITVERNGDSRLLTTEMTDQQIVYLLEDVKFSVLRASYTDEDD